MVTAVDVPYLNIFELGFDYDRPVVAEARAASRYAHPPLGPVVLRTVGAWEVLSDRRSVPGGHRYMHKQAITEGPLYEWFMGTLASHVGAERTRVKGLVRKPFTRRFTESLRRLVEITANKLVAQTVTTDGECEFMDAFADRFAGSITCGTLGVAAPDYDQFHG
jgi:cytochrome P450